MNPILDQDEQRLENDTAIRFRTAKHSAFNNPYRRTFMELYCMLVAKFTVAQMDENQELATLYQYLADNTKKNYGQNYPEPDGVYAASLKRFLDYQP
jgi:hypothetical protein